MLAWRSRLGEVFPRAGSAPGCGGSPPWSQHSGQLPVSLETRGRARPPSAGSSRQDTHTPPGGLGRACLAVRRPNPGLRPEHNKHLIHKEAKGTSRNRNVASAEEVWTPRGCPANPSGHHLGDGAHTFLGQGVLGPTVASPQGPRISEAWGQG